MWQSVEENTQKGVTKYKLLENDKLITYTTWIKRLKESPEFVTFFINLLKTSKYEGYFWEVKPVNQNGLKREFEFVLVESRTLPILEADNSSFKTYFERGKKVVTFPNLSGDAQLVVPTDIGKSSCYPHLAKFIRTAPLLQVMEFWKMVGQVYEMMIDWETKWLSTAGLGVSWLHVRIDSRPKYYKYSAYRKAL